MPRSGRPVAVMPSRSRCAMVCGIIPSPQALSSIAGPAFDDDDLQPGPRAVQRGGQAGRPAARDEQVDHVRLASALFSTLSASSAAPR